MRVLLVVLFIFFSFNSYCQTQVKLDELKNHIGDSVKVESKISEVRVYKTPAGAIEFVLLILGTEPNNELYVRINPSYATQSINLPELNVNKKRVIVFGKVERFRSLMQIVVNNSDQLQIFDK